MFTLKLLLKRSCWTFIFMALALPVSARVCFLPDSTDCGEGDVDVPEVQITCATYGGYETEAACLEARTNKTAQACTLNSGCYYPKCAYDSERECKNKNPDKNCLNTDVDGVKCWYAQAKTCSDLGYKTSCGSDETATPVNVEALDAPCYKCTKKQTCKQMKPGVYYGPGDTCPQYRPDRKEVENVKGSDGQCSTCDYQTCSYYGYKTSCAANQSKTEKLTKDQAADGPCYTCVDDSNPGEDTECNIVANCTTNERGDYVSFTCQILSYTHADSANFYDVFGKTYVNYSCINSGGYIDYGPEDVELYTLYGGKDGGYFTLLDVFNSPNMSMTKEFSVSEMDRAVKGIWQELGSKCAYGEPSYNHNSRVELTNSVPAACEFESEITKSCSALDKNYIGENASCTGTKTKVEGSVGTDGQCYICEKATPVITITYKETYNSLTPITGADPDEYYYKTLKFTSTSSDNVSRTIQMKTYPGKTCKTQYTTGSPVTIEENSETVIASLCGTKSEVLPVSSVAALDTFINGTKVYSFQPYYSGIKGGEFDGLDGTTVETNDYTVKFVKEKTCTPTCTSETGCKYGSKTQSDGCGGTCTVCYPPCTIGYWYGSLAQENCDIRPAKYITQPGNPNCSKCVCDSSNQKDSNGRPLQCRYF